MRRDAAARALAAIVPGIEQAFAMTVDQEQFDMSHTDQRAAADTTSFARRAASSDPAVTNAKIASSKRELAICTSYGVRAEGLEPSTSGLRVRCSTIELCPRLGSDVFDFQVSPGRLERPTYGFEARRSIHLSYGPSAGAVDSGWGRGMSSPEPPGRCSPDAGWNAARLPRPRARRGPRHLRNGSDRKSVGVLRSYVRFALSSVIGVQV